MSLVLAQLSLRLCVFQVALEFSESPGERNSSSGLARAAQYQYLQGAFSLVKHGETISIHCPKFHTPCPTCLAIPRVLSTLHFRWVFPSEFGMLGKAMGNEKQIICKQKNHLINVPSGKTRTKQPLHTFHVRHAHMGLHRTTDVPCYPTILELPESIVPNANAVESRVRNSPDGQTNGSKTTSTVGCPSGPFQLWT